MCDFDDECEARLANAWRRARKAHRCVACHEEIRPRDRYHVVTDKFDGVVESFKHCARCWAMGQAIVRYGDGGWQYDLDCGVSWREAFDEDPPDHVAALAFLTPDEAQALAR